MANVTTVVDVDAGEPPAFDPASIDPDASYAVRLARAVRVRGIQHRARVDHIMTGAFLLELAQEDSDAVARADPR